MDRASHPFLLATEGGLTDNGVAMPPFEDMAAGADLTDTSPRDRASLTADRVPLPSNPSRKVKGVDVLPWVLSPLMGPEEIDMDDAETLPETLQLLGLEKKREQDPVLRLMCVEILLLLATSE